MASDALVSLTGGPQFSTNAELKLATDSAEMQAYIAESFANVDIRETFSSLVECGSLLQIALTAAGEQPCSKQILKTTTQFQNLVADSTVLSGAFVDSALSALRNHKEALEIFEDASDASDLTDGLEELTRCADLASNMAKKSEQMVTKTKTIMELAEEGLLQAKTDSVNNVELRKKIEAKIAELAADQAATEKGLELLEADLEEAARKEEKLAKEASAARDRQFALEMTGAIIGGLGGMVTALNPMNSAQGLLGGALVAGKQALAAPTAAPKETAMTSPAAVDDGALKASLREKEVNHEKVKKALELARSSDDKDTPNGQQRIKDLERQNEEAEKEASKTRQAFQDLAAVAEKRAMSLEEKEAEAAKMRQELAKERRHKAGQLAKSVIEIENQHTTKTEVERAVHTLATCVQTMGVVKTTFVNAKLFWEMVTSKCNLLADMKTNYESKCKRAGKQLEKGELEKGRKMLTECVQFSGQCWAAIGRVSLDAHTTINEAKERVDGVMRALPTGEAEKEAITKLVAEMAPRLRAIEQG